MINRQTTVCLKLSFVSVTEIIPCSIYIGKFPDGYFHIHYMEIKTSFYSNKVLVATGLTQEDILGFKVDDDCIKNNVQDVLASTPNIGCHLFSDTEPVPLWIQFVCNKLDSMLLYSIYAVHV